MNATAVFGHSSARENSIRLNVEDKMWHQYCLSIFPERERLFIFSVYAKGQFEDGLKTNSYKTPIQIFWGL